MFGGIPISGVAIAWVIPLALLSDACSRHPKYSRTRAHANAEERREPASSTSRGAAARPVNETGVGCPHFAAGVRTGNIENPHLTEASDLAASTKNAGVLWSHNDSGGKPWLFALGQDGRDLGTYDLARASLIDWEDMAIGPGPDANRFYLYVGDIGGNHIPREQITIYRVEEPIVALDQQPKKHRLSEVERFTFDYPGHESHDAESLLVDPHNSDIYVVTKPRHGAPVVFRRRSPLEPKVTMVLERLQALTTIETGPFLPTLLTAGDISHDGSMLLLRTYAHAHLWPLGPGQSVDQALGGPPCSVPLRFEVQGESIAFAADGRGYYTTSEGRHAPIYFFARID